MAFSQTYVIVSLLVFVIPSVASLAFNFTNIHSPTAEIVLEGEGSYISYDGIQVTPNEIGSDRTTKAGRATYSKLLHLWDQESGELASFSTNFTFVIDSNNELNYGDGLTFFLALAQNNSDINTGGAMGLPINASTMVPTSQFVAVEFDTYQNSWDPRTELNISIEDHVGISISSLTSVRYRKWFSDITGGRECQAWITYDSVSNNLSVSFTGYGDNNTVVRQDGLSYKVDLRKELPESVIFGFSAATGLSFQKNSVRSWTFNSSVLKIDENNRSSIPTTVPERTGVPDPVKEKKSRVGLIVGISVAVISVLMFSFVLWRRHKKINEHEMEESTYDIEMNNEFEMGTGPKRFSYHELARSTSDFAENEKLGEGVSVEFTEVS